MEAYRMKEFVLQLCGHMPYILGMYIVLKDVLIKSIWSSGSLKPLVLFGVPTLYLQVVIRFQYTQWK